jgi:hypothetical protein
VSIVGPFPVLPSSAWKGAVKRLSKSQDVGLMNVTDNATSALIVSTRPAAFHASQRAFR